MGCACHTFGAKIWLKVIFLDIIFFGLLLSLLRISETRIYDSGNLNHICNQFISDFPTSSNLLSNAIRHKVSPLFCWVKWYRTKEQRSFVLSTEQLATSLDLGWTVATRCYSGLFVESFILFLGWGMSQLLANDCSTNCRKTPRVMSKFLQCRSQINTLE